MFESPVFLGKKPNSIVLQTRLGNPVENEIGPGLTPVALRWFEKLYSQHKVGWRYRKPCTAGYNCAGLVWANRRTGVYETPEVHKILADDGYRKTEHPDVDDVAVYWDDRGQMRHVARVVEVRRVSGTETTQPWVVSKWNDWGGEILHHVFDIPHREDLTIEFFTDRPPAGGSQVVCAQL